MRFQHLVTVGAAVSVSLVAYPAVTAAVVTTPPGAQPEAYRYPDNPFYRPLRDRTGANCGKNAYVVNTNAANHSFGDKNYIKLTGKPKRVPGGSRNGTARRVKFGGKRRNPKIVLCYGIYHHWKISSSGALVVSVVAHRFTVGAARGSTVAQLGSVREGVIYAIYARRQKGD